MRKKVSTTVRMFVTKRGAKMPRLAPPPTDVVSGVRGRRGVAKSATVMSVKSLSFVSTEWSERTLSVSFCAPTLHCTLVPYCVTRTRERRTSASRNSHPLDSSNKGASHRCWGEGHRRCGENENDSGNTKLHGCLYKEM